MRSFLQRLSQNLPVYISLATLLVVICVAAILASCGGTSSVRSMNGMGTIQVSLTDPPSCAFPSGNFVHVYVSIRSVQANISATASDNDPGWVELVPQLNSAPVQIDLFAAGSNACLLTMLGSNTALPAGTYQQIRLLLVANSGNTGPVPATNACGNQGYNCVVTHDGTTAELALSSQANTGLKIPPGQVEGGPITVNPGQDVDLNIDFNACASIIQEGNGTYRLKPVLTAGQVSTNSTGIDGQVVDSTTMKAIVGGTVLVALEEQVDNEPDTIVRETTADASGNFNFCPLPAGAVFDVVAVAINGSGQAYNATVIAGAVGGTALGAVPLTPETPTGGPATLQGFVTATTGMDPANIDVAVSALQSITLPGGVTRMIAVPAEGNSVANISIQAASSCPSTAPLHTNCAQYALVEPASNPTLGVFSGGKVSYAPPASGSVLYSIAAGAFVPSGGGTTDCSPSSKTVSTNTLGNPLAVTAGATAAPEEIDFSGCS